MNTFYTLTDSDTTHTNSKSQRYYTEDSAVKAAASRVQDGKAKSVVVMKAIKLVGRKEMPVEVEDMEGEPTAADLIRMARKTEESREQS